MAWHVQGEGAAKLLERYLRPVTGEWQPEDRHVFISGDSDMIMMALLNAHSPTSILTRHDEDEPHVWQCLSIASIDDQWRRKYNFLNSADHSVGLSCVLGTTCNLLVHGMQVPISILHFLQVS